MYIIVYISYLGGGFKVSICVFFKHFLGGGIYLGGGFKQVLIFIPIWGNDQFFHYFVQMGWFNHQLVILINVFALQSG